MQEKVCFYIMGFLVLSVVLILRKNLNGQIGLKRLYSCSSSQSNIKYWRKQSNKSIRRLSPEVCPNCHSIIHKENSNNNWRNERNYKNRIKNFNICKFFYHFSRISSPRTSLYLYMEMFFGKLWARKLLKVLCQMNSLNLPKKLGQSRFV